MQILTAAALNAIAPRADAAKWLQPLNDAMQAWRIDSPYRVAAFLAQIAHESAELTRLEEGLRYSAARLCQVWPKRFPTLAAAQPYANNPQALANFVYARRLGNGDTASGDGWKYRGRGLIQVTGRSNYAACAAALGVDLVNAPDELLTTQLAARSAAWFWSTRGLNELADQYPGENDDQDFARITAIINGGQEGLNQRVARWRRAQDTLLA